jgi:hypothetical protein
VNDATRTQWKNLILGSLMHPAALEQLSRALLEIEIKQEKANEFVLRIAEEAKKALGEYQEALKVRLTTDMEDNYRFRGLETADVVFLAEREQDEKLRPQFKERIASLVEERINEARKALSNVLGIKVSDLPGGFCFIGQQICTFSR